MKRNTRSLKKKYTERNRKYNKTKFPTFQILARCLSSPISAEINDLTDLRECLFRRLFLISTLNKHLCRQAEVKLILSAKKDLSSQDASRRRFTMLHWDIERRHQFPASSTNLERNNLPGTSRLARDRLGVITGKTADKHLKGLDGLCKVK